VDNPAVTIDFTGLFGRLSVPMLLVEDSSRVVALNEAAASLFKMEVADLEGQFWAGLDGQLTQILWKQRLRELNREASFKYETDLITADELLRPVSVEMVRVGDGQTLIYLRNLLAEGIDEADLELLSEDGQVGFWMYNRVDDILYLSPYLRQLTNVSGELPAREVAYALQQKMIPTDWDRLRPRIKGLLEKANAFSQLVHFTTDDGTTNLRFFAQSSGNALHVTRLFGMVRQENDLIATEDPDSISGELAAFSIDQAKDLIFWTRPDGTVSYANQAVSDLLGYSLEELKGMHAGEFSVGFEGDKVDAWWETLRRERTDHRVWELKDRAGGHHLIDAVVSYLRFGEEEYSVGFCRNVTEETIRDRRQLLTEYTLDNSLEMILWSRPNGKVYFANNTLLKRTGYTWEEMAGKDASLFFDHLTEAYRETAWKRLRAGETLEGEIELKLKSGASLPVSSKVTYLEFEGEEYNCVYLRDLTNKKKRDAQLGLSYEALNSSQDCILWLDANYRIQYANATVLNLIGVKKETLNGQMVSKIFPELDQRIIEEASTLTVTLRTAKKGNPRLSLNCSRINYDNQHFFMLVGRDITEMARRQQSLEAANEEISQLKDRLEEENLTLREEGGSGYNINNIITVSPKYQKVLQQIGKVADVNTTVLITGETGTGKELLARAVHQLSERADAPLIKVNCAALPENLIESELFGHEKGAFTGAVGRKRGRFEMADGGTLFLDEVGELPLDLQSKLLRVLQEGEFERLGGTETIKVDVRLVAATNRILQKMVRKGSFRADLFYRLNVFPIENIALRNRPKDIPVLVEHFARKFAKRQNKTITKINSADLDKLKKYPFPGNIRELENLVERAVVLCNSETLSIPLNMKKERVDKGQQGFLPFEEMQRRHIIKALHMTEGRVTGPNGAGVLLGLNDRTLVSKMRKLDIKKIDYLKAFK
jgi:PAS domain S-box-containing protein